MNVQNVNGAQWVPRRDLAPNRPQTSTIDVVDRDEYVPSRVMAVTNPYDKARDRLRTAALRRDAAATATKDTEDAKSSADDNVLAHDRRRQR